MGLPFMIIFCCEELIVSHQRVSGLPEVDPVEVRLLLGTSDLLLKFTVREVLGKSPGNFWGSSGKKSGKSKDQRLSRSSGEV